MNVGNIIREVLEVDFSDDRLSQINRDCGDFLSSRDQSKLARLWQDWVVLNKMTCGTVSFSDLIFLGYYLATIKAQYEAEVGEIRRLLEK